MKNKKMYLLASIALIAILVFQIFSLLNYDHFKAEGGMKVESRILGQDVIKKFARPSLDIDDLVEEATRIHEQKGGDFLTSLAEVNLKRQKKPLVFLLNYKEISELSIDSKDEEVIDFLRDNLENNLEITANVFERRIERLLGGRTLVNYDLEELTFTITILGQTDTPDVSQLQMPTMHLEFYSCIDYSQLSGVWETACELTEPKPLPEKEWKLTDLNKTTLDTRRSLGNTVNWSQMKLGMVKPEDKKYVHDALHSGLVDSIFPEHVRFVWSHKMEKIGTEQFWFLYPILIPKDVSQMITENDVQSARYELHQQTGQPTLGIRMTQEGTDKWAILTEENVGRLIAMCVNGEVFSAPNVISPIMDGNTQITGSNMDQMKDFELILNSRALEIMPVGSKESFVKPNPPLLNALLQRILIAVSSVLLVVFSIKYIRSFRMT